MGRMEPNPYEAPAKSVPTLPRKVTVGARVFRVGVTLAALGAGGFVCSVASAVLVLMHQGPPTFWFQLIVFVAVALVPVGIVIAVVGGVVWIWGRLRRPPNS